MKKKNGNETTQQEHEKHSNHENEERMVSVKQEQLTQTWTKLALIHYFLIAQFLD